jgi:nucleoside-diphosphate-sugar epimerase
VKYFVTGATGFVGSHVARQLVAAGHQVVAVVRTPAKASDLAALGVVLHAGDVTEKASMRDPMRGVDGVFHIAGWYKLGVRDKRDAEKVNVLGTSNVLELMRELGIPKGVYTSTLAVNSSTHGLIVDESYRYAGPHLSVYDQTKWAAHYQVAAPMIADGLPLVIVQPGLIYGPGDTSSVRPTLIQYLRRKLPLLPAKTAYSWGYIDDIAGAHLLAMERGRAGEDYIIAGPTHTLIDAINIAERITGVPGPRLHAPPAMLKGMSALMGAIEKVVPVPDQYSAEYLRVSAGATYIGSNAKARREWGYDPRPLEAGLAETLRHEMGLLGMPLTARQPIAGK